MIAVVDYGLGNLRSVTRGLEAVGGNVQVVHEPAELTKASALVLPGVGAFRVGMRNLRANGLDRAVLDFIRTGKPFLGICLGLQFLFTTSYEDGRSEGLDVIPGEVVRLERDLKIPHMGWNSLKFAQPGLPLFDGVDEGTFVYFVHSYHVVPRDAGCVAAVADYGGDVVAAVCRDNVWATQFHPEKSGPIGLKMLENFRKHAR